MTPITPKMNIGWIGLTEVVANRWRMGLPLFAEGLIGLSGNGVDGYTLLTKRLAGHLPPRSGVGASRRSDPQASDREAPLLFF